MSSISLALLLIAQASCEWVEITQQYKKPMRPTHNHPLLAFNDAEAIQHTTIKYPSTAAASEIERTTKRNRIYINHTLADHNWNKNVPSTGVNFETSVNFNDNSDNIKRKPTVIEDVNIREDENAGDVLIIRKTKPDDIKNGVRTEKPPGRKTSVPGNVIRVHPPNKGSFNKPKPLEEYTGPIEVLNLADLEYNQPNLNLIKPTKSNNSNDQRKPQIHELNTKPPAILKTVTNMRRVEILPSTKPTPIEDIYEYSSRKPLTSHEPEIVHDDRTTSTPYKFPNIGNVKRVYINSTRATHKPKPDKNRHPTTESVLDDNNFTEQEKEHEKKILRMDKLDVLQRRNTTEKSFPVRKKPSKTIFENRVNVKKVPDPEDVMLEELITEEEKTFEINVHKVASIGNIERVKNPKKDVKQNDNKVDRDNQTKNFEPTTVDETEDVFVENEETSDHFRKYSKNYNFVSSTEEVPIITTQKVKVKKIITSKRPETSHQSERFKPHPYEQVKPSKSEPKFVTNGDQNANDRNQVNTEIIKTKNEEDLSKNNASKHPIPQADEDRVSNTEDPLSNDRKDNAMENLIKFLKTVTDIIARNTRRGVHGKMKYLEDLRDTIMANIEERLEAAFPDDVPVSPDSRHKRSAEPRGHVEFPSSEGALMTISFLTFAVFLIKLVLQVIQAYKNKTMMMMPTVVAAVGRAYNQHRQN